MIMLIMLICRFSNIIMSLGKNYITFITKQFYNLLFRD